MAEFDENHRKWAYDELSKTADAGTYDEFKEAMKNPDNRKWAYGELSKMNDLGSQEDFDNAIMEPVPVTPAEAPLGTVAEGAPTPATPAANAAVTSAVDTSHGQSSFGERLSKGFAAAVDDASKIYSRGQGMMPGTSANASGTVAGAKMNEDILPAEEEQRMRDNFERTGQYFPEKDSKPSPLMAQEEKSELDKTWEERMNEGPASQWSKEQILKMRDAENEAQYNEAIMNSIAVPASTFTPEARQNAYEQWKQALKAQNPGADVDAWIKENGYDQPQQMQQIADEYLTEQYQQQNQYVGKTWKQIYDEPMEDLRKALAAGHEAGSKAAGEYLQQNQVIGGTNVPGATMYHTIEASKRYNAAANSEKAVGAALDKATQIAQNYGMDKGEFTKQILGQAYSELIASKMPQSAIENIIVNGVKQSITGQIVSATVNNEFDRMLDQMAQSAYDENVGIPESVLKGIVSFVSDSWMYMGGGATAGAAASAGMKKIIGKRIAQKLIDGGMRRGIAEATAQRAIAMMPTLGQKMAIGGAHGAGTFGAIGVAEGVMQGAITPGQMRNAEAVGQNVQDINPADYRLNYQSASEEERELMMTPEEQEKLFNGAKGTRSANEAMKGGIFGMAGGALFQGAPIADVIFRGARGVVGAMGRSLTQAGVNTGAMTAQQAAEVAYEGGEAWEQFDVAKAAAQNFGTILGLEARSIYSNVRNFRQMDNARGRAEQLDRELKANGYGDLVEKLMKYGRDLNKASEVNGRALEDLKKGKSIDNAKISQQEADDLKQRAAKAIQEGKLTGEAAETLTMMIGGSENSLPAQASMNIGVPEQTSDGKHTVTEYDAMGNIVRNRTFKSAGEAEKYRASQQQQIDVRRAGALESAVEYKNAANNFEQLLEEDYNRYASVDLQTALSKEQIGAEMTPEERAVVINYKIGQNPDYMPTSEELDAVRAFNDVQNAYNLKDGRIEMGQADVQKLQQRLMAKYVGKGGYSPEFTMHFEDANGLPGGSVEAAYKPMSHEEAQDLAEAEINSGVTRADVKRYGDGWTTSGMEKIRADYEKTMQDYIKGDGSVEGTETGALADAKGTVAGTDREAMSQWLTERDRTGTEVESSGTVAETEATEGVETPVAGGTVTGTEVETSGTVADGAGVDGAGGENLTPQQKAQEEAKQKAQMAQMRGAQIVGNDDRQGASDLRLEHETAKARVQRVFAEGSQNALTAADVMNMADSGRAQAAYQYLNDKRGELTEAQASALDQYIGAQTSVNAMQESIAQGVRDQITAHGNTMTQLMGEDGQLTRVQVMPMGNQRIMQTAYVKSGSLTNKYGAPTIMVTYVTTDENGEPVIGNTMQIAKSRVAPNSAVTEGYDEHMAQYEQDVTNNVGIMWERRSQGLDYHAGDVVPIRMNNTEAKVVVLGEDQQGNVILGDASQPDNEMLKMSMPRQIFETAVSSGRENVIQQTLTSEASKQIQEQRRAKQSAIDAKRKADIVGYDRGMIRKENGGTVDLTHKDTKPKTAAEYLVEMEGSNEAAVDWVEAQKVRLAAQEETLLTQRHDETQWIGAYGGQDNPEEADHQRRLMNIDERLQEVSRQYQKLNDIKTYAMSTEMKQRLMKERGEVILAEQKKAAQKYQKAESQRNDKYLPVDAEGEIRLGLVDASAARNYLTNNYRSFMEADEYLRGQFERIDNEGRRQRSNLDTQKSRLQAYREGREDLDGLELRQIVEAERRAQNEIDLLMAERTGLNKLDKQLETLYAEELAREWSEDPQKGRTERINRRKTDNAKLEQARKEYKDYPEAMVILDQGLEPQTLEEYVSMIGLGALSWEGYGVGEHHVRGLQEEIGKNMTRSRFGKRGDTYAFDYMLAKKAENGKGIDEISHSMAEDTPWTPEEVKRAILDMLMNASKPDDIRSYIIRNRLEAAETAARHQDEAELAAAEEAEWQARNAGTEVETSGTVAGAEGEASGTVAGAEDPFAGGGTEGLYDNYDFSLDSQELIDKHNERAKQDGGLISNDGSKSLTLGMASLLDRVGNQVGRTIRIATADEIWNALTPAQQKVFGGKEGLKRLGAGYNDPKNNQLVMNGAYLASRNDPAEVVRVVLGHELTHIIKAMNSPEVWNTYVELVKNALGENVFNHNLNLVRRRYEGMPGYTGADKEQKFIEEVCANYAGDNKFTSDRDIQKLVDVMDAYGVDMSAFTDTVRRILDMLNDLEDMARQLNDEGLLSDFDVEDVKDVKQEALDTWDQMYKTAVEKVEAKRASVAEDGGTDFMLVTDPHEIKAFDDAPKRLQYRSMQLIDGKLYPPMATVVGKGKDKKRQDGLSIGDLFKADENPQLAKPVIDKTTGEQKINPETGKLQYTFKLDKGGNDDFGEKMTDVNAAYNPYVHSSNSPINDQFATAYKRSNLVTVKGEISEDDINSGYWAEKAHDSVGEKDWKLGVTSTALEKAGKVARKVTLSQYFRPTEIVPTEEVAKYYAEQLKGTDITIPFNTVGPELREALVKLGVTISEPEKSNAGRASMPAYEEWKAASVKEPSGKAEGTVAVGAAEAPLANEGVRGTGQIRDLVPSQKKDAEGNSFYERNGNIDLWEIDELLGKAGRQQAPVRLTDRNIEHILDSHSKEFAGNAENVVDFIDDVFDGANILRKAKGRAMFVVVENTNNDKVAVIKMFPSEYGDYYNIDTIGYYRKNKWKKEEEIIGELSEPAPSESASNPSKPQAPNNSGKEPLNAKGQLSVGKGTNNSGNDQINQRKNTENQPKTAENDVQWALQPLEERVSGWALEDAQDLIADVRSVGGEVDDNGVVTVYHRTNSPEAVRSILSSGVMKTKEPAVFFSTHQKGSNNYGYGNWGVKLRIPAEKLQVDDVFTDELTLKMPLKGYKADVRQYLAEDNSDVQWALDVAESAPWLSNAAEGLNKIKQEKATGEQWVKMLQKNGGLKAEEDKWIGLSEWLMGAAEAPLTNMGKDKQAEIIRKSNPKNENLGEHTWITSAADILTFEEALKDFSGTPDYTLADAEKAQKTGKIKVYSSYPIKNGNFVTPSRMEAENYAGGGTVYKKVVNVNDVAWIDSNEGQIAVVDNTFTKAQVRQFIEENAVKIEDVEYGDTELMSTEDIKSKYPEIDAVFYTDGVGSEELLPIKTGKRADAVDLYNEKNGTDIDPYDCTSEELSEVRRWATDLVQTKRKEIDDTRLGYTTDGLTNKREIAMVVPGIEPYNQNDEIHFGDAGKGRAVAWVRFGDADNFVTETSTDEGALKALSDAEKAFDDYQKKLEEKYGTTNLFELVTDMSHEDNAEWNRLDEEITKANEAVNKTKRNKVLVMDEVQSKRHQDGRERGYRTTNFDSVAKAIAEKYGFSKSQIEEYPYDVAGYIERHAKDKEQGKSDANLIRSAYDAEYGNDTDNMKVPDAPFRKNWHEIGMKRMLRYAAENGYDKLAWTTGTQQAARYDLGEVVEQIDIWDWNDDERSVFLRRKGARASENIDIDRNGIITYSSHPSFGEKGQNISGIYGKELSVKMLGENAEKIDDLTVFGGEGMKGFYDQMLVKFMDKYCKKWGVKVQDVELDLPNEADRVMHSVDITPEMKDEILDGQLMWMLAGEIGAKNLDEASKEKMQKEDGKKTIDNMQNLALANVLEKRGAEALDIKRATGWEKGKDGKWRLELPDMRLRMEPDEDAHTVIELSEGETLRLGDIVEEDNGLFEAYPELADVDVNGDAHGSTMGSYNPGTNVLSLNVDDLNNVFKSLENTERSLSRFDAADDEERKMILELADVSSEKLYKERLEARKSNYEGALEIVKAELVETIAHEVQHYIQHVEGFAAGGNMQMDAPESLKAERREAYELELKALREELDAKEEAANKAEDAMREAHRKYNEYVYVEDKEFGGMAFSKVLSESEKGRELYADYRRLYDAFDKAYDEEIAVSRKIRDIQDAIDAPLGRAGYQRLAGEVEARAVGARTFMTPQQRRETLARSSEDVERERQIVIQDMKPSRAESARTEANASGTVAGARGRSLGNSGEAMSQWLTERDRTVADAEGVNWMLGEVRMRGDVTTEANLEAWEKAKNAYPDKVVVMQDGQGYVTFRDDARKMSEAIGKVPEESGVLRLNYGEYVTAQDKLGDVVDEAQWSGFEEWPGVDDSAWVDGKVRGKDAKAFVNGHPELRRLRKNIAKAYDGNGNIEGAVEDYRQALQGMMDGEREDIKVLKGAQRIMLEQLSELNDIEEGKKAPVFDVEAEPAPKAKGTKRGTKANALGTVAGNEGEASGTVARKARGKKTAEPRGKTQKEWQKTAPSDEEIVKEIWADPESMEHTTGEYYEGDNQALAHAVKNGESGAIREAARRMALYMQYHFEEMYDEVRPTKEDIQQYERENTVLVPVPSHGGKATYTLKLAKELSKRTGIPVVNALHSEPYESSYAKKARGEKPEVPEMEMSDDYDVQMAVRDAKMVMLIDNVEATGDTMFEAEVGISGYTDGSVLRFPFVKDNSKTLPLGEKSVSLQADEASRVRWQARELPSYAPEQPWKDVKKATVHTSNIRKRHPQTYYAAKHGDVKAAHELVTEVVKPHVLVRMAVEHPDAMVAYPHYESTEGSNAIPAAYAQMFERYGLTVDTEIVQRNRVHRTDATRYDRLMNRARFAGDVIPGQEYILVDDHITSGATLRDMKDYIESEGGVVVAWSALEGSAGSTNVEITEENKTKLKELGVTDEQVQELGISRTIDNLTNAEARELASLAKRGRDFRSKAQQEEHARAVKGTEPTRQGTRADKRAAEAESRRLRERAEAEKRFEDLRREQERFVKLFGEMPAEAPLETREGTEADASGTVAGTEVETSGTVAELVSGGRYVDVSGIKPERGTSANASGTVAGTEGDASGTVAGTVAAEWDAQIKAAREAVNGNPTDGQKEAGNYKKGHVRLDGLNISIENAKGSTRSGRDADGKEWSVTMHYDYGDIRGRVGVDGDNIDVYLSDRPYEGYVFVIDQVDPKTGEFDEHKVMYGFNSEEEAREAYLSNYEKGWKGLGDITGVGKNYFKEWLQSSRRKRKPFKEYVNLPRVKHPDSGMTERGRQEVARIQREMYEMYLAEADRLIEEEKKRSIEERYGRFPGDPVSLRDRGIWLTPKQRESLKNMVNYTYKVLNRQNETGRSGGWNMLGAYPGKPMWYPENVDDTDEALAEAQREKEAAQGKTEKATSVETSMGVEEEKPEVPFVLTPEETPAAAKARIRRENARRRVKARLNGEEVPAEAPLGTVAGTEGKASGMVAGMPARVEADGQTALWESGPDTGSDMTMDDVMNLQWQMGTNAQRPRRKKGESDFAYISRVAAWEVQQQKLASAPPAPNQEDIEQRWNGQYEQDHASWVERHDLGELMTSEPKRGDYDSVDEYADALREWEKQSAARADADDPEPQAFDYMVKAQDEYRDAYAQWQRDNDIHEEGEGMLDFSTIFTGEMPQPKTVVGKNVETGEEVEMPADEVLAAEVAESQAVLRDLGEAAGINVDARGARRAAHVAIVDRQARLGMMRSEDALFIHELEGDIKTAAKELGMKADELNKMLPFIIESPTRLTEIVEATYFDMRKHPLDFYTVKHLLPEIFGNEPSDEPLVNDIRGVMNQALEGGGDAELTAAMRHYELQRSPELKSLLEKVSNWYDAYFTMLEDNGLNRNDAHRVTDYVNHDWDMANSDQRAIDTWKNMARTTSKNMKQREIMTLAKGIEIGLKPKYETLTGMMGSYSNKNTEAIANRKFLDDLSGLCCNLYNTDGEVINVLSLLSSEEPMMMIKDNYTEFEVPGVGKVWVLKDAEGAFTTIFGDKGLKGHQTLQNIWDGWLTTNGAMKMIQLSLSGFHALALTEAAFAQNPLLCAKSVMSYILYSSALKAHERPAFAHPEDMKDAAAHLVQLGATNDYASAEVRKFTRSMRDKMTEWATKSDKSRLSGIGKTAVGGALFTPAFIADVASTGMDTMLWEYVHDGLKTSYYKHYAAQVRKKSQREGWDEERTERQLMNVGQYVNDIFGGQHWPVIGITPLMERILRTMMLSPDWNWSTTRQAMSVFGLGGVYSDNNLLRYITERVKNKGKKPQEDLYWEVDKDGAKFRAKRGWEMLAGVVLMTALYNVWNVVNRMSDEEKEFKKADEIRHKTPGYLSPYELQYPYGMKWYDYTMWGNSLNRRSRLFLGRGDDGVERYARFGKQFQELPDYFEGEYGFEFPGPLIKRLRTKQSPMLNLWDSLTDFWGASPNGKMSTESEQLRKRYGNAVGTLSLVAKNVIPFSMSGDWDDKTITEFFMPVGKGFSKWKAKKGFEHFIANDDWNGIDMVIRSCQLNGIEPEPIFENALSSIETMARDERMEGVTDLKTAMEAFNATSNLKDRNTLKRKMAKYMTQQNYRRFTIEEARERVDQKLSGEDDVTAGISDVQKNIYLKTMTAEDCRDEIIITKANAAAKDIKQKAKAMAQNGNTTFAKKHAKEIGVAKTISSYRTAMNKLKKTLGNGNDEAVMEKIRKLRKELVEKVNEAR